MILSNKLYFVLGIMWLKIKNKLSWNRRELIKIAVACVILGGLAVGLSGFAIWQVKRCSAKVYDNVTDIPAREYGLVLGTSKYVGGYENRFFRFRIAAAAELYFAGKIKKIIVSGDNMQHGYNEPEDMQQALIELGVKSEDILLDYAGFRTLDSVVRARNVFNVTKYIVISQKFHCTRAIFLAEAHELEVIGYAARDPQFMLKTKVRESLACLLAWADVYILNRKPHFVK